MSILAILATTAAVITMVVFVGWQIVLMVGVACRPAIDQTIDPERDQQSPSVGNPTLLGRGDHGRVVEHAEPSLTIQEQHHA